MLWYFLAFLMANGTTDTCDELWDVDSSDIECHEWKDRITEEERRELERFLDYMKKSKSASLYKATFIGVLSLMGESNVYLPPDTPFYWTIMERHNRSEHYVRCTPHSSLTCAKESKGENQKWEGRHGSDVTWTIIKPKDVVCDEISGCAVVYETKFGI